MSLAKYTVKYTKRFEKDLEKARKRGWNTKLIIPIIDKLANGEPLDAQNKDHALSGTYAGFRECHIKPDWLLIYKIENDQLVLLLQRTGTHSDLL